MLQAEVRALAKRMLRKRSRDELLEGAYNKYAFHDAGLPRWFAEDQRRHARCAPAHSRNSWCTASAGPAGCPSAHLAPPLRCVWPAPAPTHLPCSAAHGSWWGRVGCHPRAARRCAETHMVGLSLLFTLLYTRTRC